jgi:hypothetical protein
LQPRNPRHLGKTVSVNKYILFHTYRIYIYMWYIYITIWIYVYTYHIIYHMYCIYIYVYVCVLYIMKYPYIYIWENTGCHILYALHHDIPFNVL